MGDYDSIVSDYVKLKNGAKVNFKCPKHHCGESLTSHFHDEVCEIKMVDEEDQVYVVFFNRIFGKHATFLADYRQRKIQGTFGQDKEDYIHGFKKQLIFFVA